MASSRVCLIVLSIVPITRVNPVILHPLLPWICKSIRYDEDESFKTHVCDIMQSVYLYHNAR